MKRRARTLEEDDLETKEEEEATTRLSRQPSNIKGGQMRPYQLEGLNWMIRLYDHGMNGILADEMGLGKTLQCISMLAWLREGRKIEGPHLILVPKSTLGNWMNEFARWCPEIRAVRFHGPKPDRAAFVRDVLKPGASRRDYDVVVTTYEVANAEQKSLEKVSWRFVVIDEAHRIKNEASLFARTARSLRAERRLLVTGTPLQNNLHELWALLNFLLPDVFASSDQFDEWCAPASFRPRAEALTPVKASRARNAGAARASEAAPRPLPTAPRRPKSPQNRKTNRPPPPFPEATSCEPPVSLRGRAGSILMWTTTTRRRR